MLTKEAELVKSMYPNGGICFDLFQQQLTGHYSDKENGKEHAHADQKYCKKYGPFFALLLAGRHFGINIPRILSGGSANVAKARTSRSTVRQPTEKVALGRGTFAES
ncbi:hypothetical protein B0H19DRAFT_1229537 [Mycena capillaripes]|nr:hypothetical protein B0H19DRAFT_1229537 [Mycena capillaripes]